MTEFVIECRFCSKCFRIDWNPEERENIEVQCPHCGRLEISELTIVEDSDYPTLDYFRRTVPINVPPYERYNPLKIGETELDLSPVKRREGATRMKRIESLDFRRTEEEDSLLKKARKILTKILGGGE